MMQFLVWFMWSWMGFARAQQDVWLIGIFPFTGADWDAGLTERFGAEIMLEEINKHSTLLPNHTLKVLYMDGLCSKGMGTRHFMKAVFSKTYESFAPGILGLT